MNILLTALLLTASGPSLYDHLLPQDIELPPKNYQRIDPTMPIHVEFFTSPEKYCLPSKGYLALACTVGRPGHSVSLMPDPCLFFDDRFAEAVCKAKPLPAPLLRESCLPKYRSDVFARLSCHEIVGHQMNGWIHPKLTTSRR